MKKVIFALLLVMLLAPLISSQTEPTAQASADIKSSAEKFDNYFDNPLPKKIQPVGKVLFKFDEETTNSEGIITVLFFFFFVIILVDTIIAFSMFSRTTAYGMAISIMVIFSVLGGIKSISKFLISASEIYPGFIENWWYAKIVFLLIVVLILVITLKKVLHVFRKERGKLNAIMEGMESGATVATSSKVNKALADGEDTSAHD